MRRHLAAVWHLADDVADLTGREVATPPPSHGSSMLIGGVRKPFTGGKWGEGTLQEWQTMYKTNTTLLVRAAPRAKASVFGRVAAEARAKAVCLSPARCSTTSKGVSLW